MDDIQYVGELLWAGNLGHLFTILSMTAALLASMAYGASAQARLITNRIEWRRLARTAFGVHSFAVLGIIITLFLLIFNQRYEFQYVWQHSSNELPVYYMLSCFWEGQEGSFLLWTFWHVVLGWIVIRQAGKWEAPVMAFVSVTQFFLAAMLIGIYFFDYKIGSSPFVLMRDFSPQMPIFMRADYLSLIKDGNGLNPLLQNYWMVIHPPVLFLGFASTIMPFAYALAGAWKNEFDAAWTRITLRWTLFSTAILGVGILMGAAWAYEALSFGGYWAWDPVENASLVPWIVSIAGLHTLLAYKHSGYSLKSTLILLVLTFVLILYSTFLTRSGILGDTSVHAFTDLGMSGQLLVFLLSFVFLSIILLIVRWRKIPSPQKEEKTWSREFWMFVGSLVILLLAVMIGIDTSWPVINKITGGDRVIVDAVSHYNRYSIWFAMVIMSLSAMVLYFRYKSSPKRENWQRLAFNLVVSLLLTVLFTWRTEFPFFENLLFFNLIDIPFISKYFLLALTAIFGMVANFNYIFAVLKGKIAVSGAAVAHFGFAMMLLGTLLSSGKKEVISINNLGIDYGEGFDEKNNLENVYLAKNKPIQMGEYWVTYTDNFVNRQDTYYQIEYQRKQGENDPPSEKFELAPYAQVNPKMGLISNPDAKHYWTKDVFTYISSIPQPLTEEEKSKNFEELEVSIGDTVGIANSLLYIKAINPNPSHPEYFPLANDIAAGLQLEVRDVSGHIYPAEPVYFVRNLEETSIPSVIEEQGLTIRFTKIMPQENKVRIEVIEEQKEDDFVILKAIVFPYINLLWFGCMIMTLGFGMAWMQRRERKRKAVTV